VFSRRPGQLFQGLVDESQLLRVVFDDEGNAVVRKGTRGALREFDAAIEKELLRIGVDFR